MSDSPTVDDLLARADAWPSSGGPMARDLDDAVRIIDDLAAALRAQTAENKELHSKRAQETLLKQNAETENVRLTNEMEKLGDAQDRLDENEGTIAALRHQLAQERDHDARCESEFLNPPGAYTPCGCKDRRREAVARAAGAQPEALARTFHETYERLAPEFAYETRPESRVAWEDVPDNNRALMIAVCAALRGAFVGAVAPQPLWTGVVDQLPDSIFNALPDNTPPTTVVVLHRAGQTPGVTREQVLDAVHEVLRPWMYPDDMAGDEAAAEEFEDVVPLLTDAVWALLAGEGTSHG